MKTYLHKTLLFGALVGTISVANAQEDMSSFFKTGITDAEKLLNAYTSPLLKSLSAGVNSGWFNTAKPHGAGGFDITISPNVAFIPDADKSFDVTSLGLSNNTRLKGSQKTSPTFGGETTEGPEVGIYGRFLGQDTLLNSLKLPQGTGAPFLPAIPTAQLAVGVGFNTEVAVRFFPKIKTGGFEAGLFGFAVKHDFKQWIPGMKDLPFDLSAMFGYTSMSASYTTDALEADQPSSSVENPNPNKVYEQTVELTSKGYTFNVLISKKLSFFTPYLGLGFQSAKTTLDFKGEYPITEFNTAFNPSDPNSRIKVVREYKDPVALEGTLSGLRATGGFRLKLAVLTIHADYTMAKYNVASVGIGINIQSIAPFKL